MSDSTRNPSSSVSVATLARASVRQHNYTDARVAELSARLDAVQVTLRTNRERIEMTRCRVRFADRMAFVILAAILAVCLDRCTGIPHCAVIAIGTLPECAREVFEFLRRL